MNETAADTKKRVFIGSSSETKELADKIKLLINKTFNCVAWYEDFFSLGGYVFRDLIQKVITFDYAILIGGSDDLVTRISTDTKKISPRDNIYIEYGLFTGALTNRRVLFLLNRKCEIASDLKGMTLKEYDTDEEALQICEKWIMDSLDQSKHQVFDVSEIELLPTVGIAVGYYYNFLEPLVKMLDQRDSVVINGEEYCLKNFIVNVIIPYYEMDDDINSYVNKIRRSYKLKNEIIHYRVMYDPVALNDNILTIYDVPTTIIAVFKTVNYIFGVSTGNTEDTKYAKQRALENFYDNVLTLISGNMMMREHVRLVHSQISST